LRDFLKEIKDMNQQIQPPAAAPVVPFAAPQPGLKIVGVAVDTRFVLNVNEKRKRRKHPMLSLQG
jgi:hypothetical protein